MKLLIATSLNYLGSPHVAHFYLKGVFPTLTNNINNKEIIFHLTNEYASFLIRIDSASTARKVYLTNLKRYIRSNDSLKIFNTRNNLGFSYYMLGMYDSAKTYYRLNQKESNRFLNPTLYAFAFGNYGSALLQQRYRRFSDILFKKEISLLNQLNTKVGMTNSLTFLGKAYEKIGNLDSASHYFHKALIIGKEEGNLDIIVNNYKNLIRIYTIHEKDPLLNIILKKYFNYNDSLQNRTELRLAEEEAQIPKYLEIFTETEESKEEK